MLTYFQKFIKSEDGAVTVDWVVLTAALAGFCIMFIAELKSDSDGLAANTQEFLEDQDPVAAAGRNIQGEFGPVD